MNFENFNKIQKLKFTKFNKKQIKINDAKYFYCKYMDTAHL